MTATTKATDPAAAVPARRPHMPQQAVPPSARASEMQGWIASYVTIL